MHTRKTSSHRLLMKPSLTKLTKMFSNKTIKGIKCMPQTVMPSNYPLCSRLYIKMSYLLQSLITFKAGPADIGNLVKFLDFQPIFWYTQDEFRVFAQLAIDLRAESIWKCHFGLFWTTVWRRFLVSHAVIFISFPKYLSTYLTKKLHLNTVHSL